MAITSTPRAKWFVIAVHWEMTAMLVLMGVGSIAAPFLVWQWLPWPWMRWMTVAMAVMGPPAAGYIAYSVIRRALWLQGRGSYAEPILAPTRANTLVILLASGFFVLMGIFQPGPLIWKAVVTVAGLFGLAFEYPAVRWAWARETAINEERQ